MTRIPLSNIFERIFQTQGMTSQKEIDGLLARMEYDKVYGDKIDKLLALLTDQLKKGVKLEDVELPKIK